MRSVVGGATVAGVVTFALTAVTVPLLRPRQALELTDAANLRAIGAATLAYASDNDQRMPLAHGRAPDGTHGTSYLKYVPFDWPKESVPHIRKEFSRVFVLNSIQPYLADLDVLYDKSSTQMEYQPWNQVAPGKAKLYTTYAYNGYLHSYATAAVAAPTELPLFTGLNGRAAGLGVGFANPALSCYNAQDPACHYVPRSGEHCTNNRNGSTGIMYGTFSSYLRNPETDSYWMHKRGQNWAFADGHVAWRRLGAVLAPGDTDRRVDPLTSYDNTGRASFYWWNGCHAWLFRPDHDFRN